MTFSMMTLRIKHSAHDNKRYINKKMLSINGTQHYSIQQDDT
jgi:hypothetical protein